MQIFAYIKNDKKGAFLYTQYMSTNDVFYTFTSQQNGSMKNVENRRKFLDEQGLSNTKDLILDQVHGNRVVVIDEDYNTEQTTSADSMITCLPNLALFVYVADCLPVILFDSEKKVIGTAHAGREGTFQGIIKKAILTFKDIYQSQPENIQVHIGPHVGLCCYEVSTEMATFVADTFGAEFVNGRNIDLLRINLLQLAQAGIPRENIFSSSKCTVCDSDKKYFSYRRTGLKDSFAGVIALLP